MKRTKHLPRERTTRTVSKYGRPKKKAVKKKRVSKEEQARRKAERDRLERRRKAAAKRVAKFFEKLAPVFLKTTPREYAQLMSDLSQIGDEEAAEAIHDLMYIFRPLSGPSGVPLSEKDSEWWDKYFAAWRAIVERAKRR